MFSRASALVTLCMVYFGMGMANAAMGPLLPVLAGNAGLALSEAGLIFSVAFFGGIFANPAGGPISDRIGRGPVLLVSILMGLGFGPVFPTIVALVGRTFGRSAGTAMGITMTLGTVGGMFFVWIEGILMAGIGPAAGVRLFGFTIVGIALLAVAARFLTRSTHSARPQAG